MNAPPVPGRIRGLSLRRLLTDMLASERRPLSVAELDARCRALGVGWGAGRSSKVISDALRWEIAHGRVVRTAPSHYQFAGAPRTTLWRIRREAAEIRARLPIATDADNGDGGGGGGGGGDGDVDAP